LDQISEIRTDRLLKARFPHADSETLRILSLAAQIRAHIANDVVHRQGDDVPLRLVLDGFGAARRMSVDGRELVVAVLRRGDLIGFLGLASLPAASDFVALTDFKSAEWSSDRIRSLATADPGLAVDLVESSAAALAMITQRLDGLIYQNSRTRVARVLADYRDLFFESPPVLLRSHLPSLVGTSREMTGRVLRQLERERIVSRTGHGLVLLSAKKLQRLAEGMASKPGV
jgi:CRP/FNR family transcriptional regulator, cyclic AMP receptor protein